MRRPMTAATPARTSAESLELILLQQILGSPSLEMKIEELDSVASSVSSGSNVRAT